jgi:predicted nucleic acid-binding protein
MNNAILDSSVLIDCLRGRSPAVSYLSAHSAAGQPMTHIIVAAELLAGARDRREQEMIESFLTALTLIPPTESDSLAALDLYKRHRLSHGVDWPDCPIAATALRLDAEVHTLNIKHFFPFPNLRSIRPY